MEPRSRQDPAPPVAAEGQASSAVDRGGDLVGPALFYALAVGLAWLACLPLWRDPRGLRHPLAPLCMAGMMLTPAVATAIVTLLLRRERSVVDVTGLRLVVRGGGWRFLALGWAGTLLVCVPAPFVAWALGAVALDLRGFSGFRETILAAGDAGRAALQVMPLRWLAALQIAQGLLLAPLVNAPFTFGEEWGWRGYLLPKLLPWGRWRALVASGVCWGLWHAPVLLLGYNYPRHPRLGVLLMTVLCVLFGILFGWVRMASGSVWPAVLAHGALNGAAGLLPVLARAGADYDTAVVGITGWTGWLLPLAAVLALAASGRIAADVPAPAARAGGGR